MVQLVIIEKCDKRPIFPVPQVLCYSKERLYMTM